MSFIQNFYTSRDNNTDGNTYVGQEGRLWYNPDTNSIYVNTANVAGGTPVDLATGANAAFDGITVNTIGTDDSSVLQFITDVNFNEFVSVERDLTVSGNIVVTGNISAAAEGKIGGIQPGPGVNISNTGLLTIDSANLEFSFGNFTANNNILTIVNVDEDMILATQGDAEIQLVGNIGFYKSNGLPPNVINRYFFARDDGQLRILVPAEDPLEGGVEIIGSSTGNYVTPGAPGTMLQLTGNPNISCRLYQDSLNSYSSFIGRRYNGNTASPGQVLAGEDVLRFNATAATDAGMGNVAMAQISITALENQTTTAQGSEITFTVTPIGSSASSRVDVANITVANGVTATQFTTAGNVTAGNVNSFVTLPAGTAAQSPLVFTAGNIQIIPPTEGSMSYDGTVFYATPQDAERGLVVTEQLFIPNADYPLIDQTAVQNLFGSITTVSSNTRYAYRIMAVVYKVSNNISLQYATGGNLTLAKHTYETSTTATSALATPSTPTVTKNVLTTGFSTPVTVSAAVNGTGYYGLTVTGTLNVTTGGTWYPQIAFTGTPGVGSNVFAGSSIEIWPIGPTGANVSIGNWS